MTLQMMLEIVRQQFPEKMDTQVRLDLNNAYLLYSEETRLPFSNLYVTAREDGRLETNSTPLECDQGWVSLPLSVSAIVTVAAYDSRSNEINRPEYEIEYVGRKFRIVDLNNMLYSGSGLPSPIAMLKFGCSLTPSALLLDSDVPDYPEAFHQGLIDHVLAKYFGLKGILQQSGWFRAQYQSQVQSGKRYFNRTMG